MALKLLALCVVIFYTTLQSVSANSLAGYVPLNDKDMIFSNLPSTMKLHRFGDSIYYIGVIFKGNFFQSMQFCKYHGMDLVSIETREENDFLYDILKSYLVPGDYLFWTGGVKTEPDNRWVWISTGHPMVYFNWLTGQPGNTPPERYMEVRYIQTAKALVYNDQIITQVNNVICEMSVPKSISF